MLATSVAVVRGAPPQNHNGPNLESVMRELDREAKELHSLTADIERTTVTVVVNDKSTESGRIFLRTDGKMRIEFAKPDQRMILRNGDKVIENPSGLRSGAS